MQTLVVDGEKVRRQRTDTNRRLGWRLRVHDPRNGKQSEATFYGSYEAAVRELATRSAEIAAQVAPAASHRKAITVGDWVERWLPAYAWKVPPSSNGMFPGVRREFSSWSKASSITLSS